MRFLATLLFSLGLVAWVGAQPGLDTSVRVNQLRNNRMLLETLVGRSVELSSANQPLDRAATCRNVMKDLTTALETAINTQDASRVAELGDHLTAIVSDGLMPSLAEADADIPPTSTDRLRLTELHKSATEDFSRLELSVPRMDVLGRSAQVKETLTKWKTTNAALMASKPAQVTAQPSDSK